MTCILTVLVMTCILAVLVMTCILAVLVMTCILCKSCQYTTMIVTVEIVGYA